MKNSSHKASSLTRIMRGLFISAFVMAMMGLSTQARAVTAAGTVIQNQALVEYTDEEGNAQEARSNWARISVKQIYSATIAQDIRDLKAGSNQTVYFQHILTNTGNGTDFYDITVTSGDSTQANTPDFVVLDIFWDINSNGQIDAGEGSVDGDTIELAAGQLASLVVEAQIPTSTSGNTYALTVEAEARQGTGAAVNNSVDDLTAGQGADNADDTNEDLVTVTTDAALNVNKSYVYTPPTYTYNNDPTAAATDNTVVVNPGVITYTITVTNTGLKDAQSVVVWDGIPFNADENNVTLRSNVGFGDGSNGANITGSNVDVDDNDKSIQLAQIGNDTGIAEEALDCGGAPFRNAAETANAGCVLVGSAARQLLYDTDPLDLTAYATLDKGDSTEATIGADLNGDGDTADGGVDTDNGEEGLFIVYGYDDVLPANTTISYSYSVEFNNHRVGEHITGGTGTSYDADNNGIEDTVIVPGDLIPNTAYVSASLDGDDVPESFEESNKVIVEVPAYPAVVALDTNEGNSTGGASIVTDNDGGDDDGDNTGNAYLPAEDTDQETAINGSADNQYVERAATSMVVDFEHLIMNGGNGEDTFDLTIDEAADTFPPGTEFTFLDSTGNNPLLDTDLDGIVDTGPMAAGGTLEITVKAHLPDTIDNVGICTADSVPGVGVGVGIVLQQSGTPTDTSDDFYFYDSTGDCSFAGGTIGAGMYDEDDYFKYELTATSSIERTDTNAFDSDTTDGRLGAVYVPGVDLTNGAASADAIFDRAGAVGADSNDQTNHEAVDLTADLEGSVQHVNETGVGETTIFELIIQNDSYQEDTFQIYAGRGVTNPDPAGLPAADGKFTDGDPETIVDQNDLMGMWPGWNVVFKDVDGNVVTGTPSLSYGETHSIFAHVTTSPDVMESLADLYNTHSTATADPDNVLHPLDVDIDNADADADPSDGAVTESLDNVAATVEKLDASGDGRGEYPVFFMIVSTNTNAYDIKLDAVQVSEQEDVVLVYDNEGQVQPGGSIDYPHVLKNVGNTEETFELTDNAADLNAVQGQGNSAENWSNVFYVYVDTDGDCSDTDNRDWKPWYLLDDGDAVVINENYETTTALADCEDYEDTSGTAGWSNATDGLKLRPDEELYIKVRVFSPSSAPNGEQDYVTITAAYNITGAAPPAYSDEGTVNTDRTTVILGQLRVYKTVAPDVDCDGDSIPDAGAVFKESHDTRIEPSDCAVWQLIVINEGDTDAENVIVYDSAPDFSQIVDATYTSASLATGAGGRPAINFGADESYHLRSCQLDGAVAVDDAQNRVRDVTCLDATGISHANHAHNFTNDLANADYTVSTALENNDGGGAAPYHDAYAESDRGGNVYFYIGDGAADGTGGTLKPGEAWLLRFSTQVE